MVFFTFSMINIIGGRFIDNKVYLIIVSLSSMFISSMMVYLMFKTTTVQGTDRIYELGPDLGIVKETMKKSIEVPDEADCAVCKRTIYKPFLCSDCKHLHCGQHSLPSDHYCSKTIN